MRSNLLRSQLQNEGWALANACSLRVGSIFPCLNVSSAAAAEHTVSISGSHDLPAAAGAASSHAWQSSSSSAGSQVLQHLQQQLLGPLHRAAGITQQLLLSRNLVQLDRGLCTSRHQGDPQQNLAASWSQRTPFLQQHPCLPQATQLQLHTAHQLQQQRGAKQLRPYAEAPKLPPKFKRPSNDGRMNTMVIRIPPQVTVAVQDGLLHLTGKAGNTSVKLSTLDPSGLVAWRCLTQLAAAAAAGPGTGSLLLMASPSKRHWRSIQTHIDNAVHGAMQGYLVGLTVQGVGYRLEPVAADVVKAAVAARRGDAAAQDSSSRVPMFWEQEAEKSNIVYPHKQPAKAVRLKVGFTKAAIFPLPEGVLGLCVKPTLMYLYGVDKHLVTNTAAAIRAVRKPNSYTGNGIQLVGETVRLKQRAGSK